MIKLVRCDCPSELTSEIKRELTDKFISSGEAVWKDSRIKEPIKRALLGMSYRKCAYCECRLEKENNYTTVEHIVPKKGNEESVLEWSNLLPACCSCNGHKTNQIDTIIDPSLNNPTEHLWMDLSKHFYRIYGKSSSEMGKNTVGIFDMNNISTLRKIRSEIGEQVKEKAEYVCKKMNESIAHGERIHYSYKNKLISLLEECCKKSDYSATAATALYHYDLFQETVQQLKEADIWNSYLQDLYNEIESIKFDVSDD